ncbi:MAG TPA: X2-like carbohydrate binding domain-containing protein, partial [Clostridia bacterium]
MMYNFKSKLVMLLLIALLVQLLLATSPLAQSTSGNLGTLQDAISDNQLDPAVGAYDSTNIEDINIDISKSNSKLIAVKNGTALLTSVDYSVSGSNVVIRKSYLSYYFNKFNSPGQKLNLIFDFENGNDPVFTVTPIVISNYVKCPNPVFDISNPQDLTLSVSGAQLSTIKNGTTPLTSVDYSVYGNNVTIKKGYLTYYFSKFNSPGQKLNLTFDFVSGNDPVFTITKAVISNYVRCSNPVFNPNNPQDLTATIEGTDFLEVKNGDTALKSVDYSVYGNSVTIKKSYLTYYFNKFNLLGQKLNLTFDFKSGNDPVLIITALAAAKGFTVLNPSADTRKIYVSSSQGNDSNSGLSEESPVKTIQAGISKLREGYPDWLLLKKGDVWKNESFGFWNKSGRSSNEMMVLASYGKDSERPIVEAPKGQYGIRTVYNSGGISNLAIMGIHFYGVHMDPDSKDFTGSDEDAGGLFFLSGAKNILIEDCNFHFYGVALYDWKNAGMENVTIRRCLFLDAYATQSKAQGMYLSYLKNSVIEECIFDHSGWNDKVSGANATIFSHSLYIGSDCDNITVRNNIFLRSSSHALQLRCNGTAEGNLCVRNPIGLQLGSTDNPKPGGVEGSIINNVILEGNDIAPDKARGWGIDLLNIKAGVVKGNIVANFYSPNKNGLGIRRDANTQYSDNILYNWITSGYDIPWPQQGPFKDPERSVEKYNKLIGGQESFE